MKIDILPSIETGRPIPLALSLAGQVADANARRSLFADYQARRSAQTLRQQRRNLVLFRQWLDQVAADPGDLFSEPAAWQGLTWGLVANFTRWQLERGYAVSTVNARLATIKRYAGLALQAGSLEADQYAMIGSITGYGRKEARHLDLKRVAAGLPVRQGHKAAQAVALTPEQAEALKNDHPDTPQGRRDRLLMCLLLDHGLRCGEVAGLQRANLRLKQGELHFFRPKVDRQQIHRLSRHTRLAARSYVKQDQTTGAGPLLLASHKSGQLVAKAMSNRAITKRVRHLGQRLGIEGLSAHDCRHYWASQAARSGTPLDRLQEAGGWSSPAMPLHYIEVARIANEGVRLK